MVLIIVSGVLEEQGPAYIGILRIEHDVCSIVIQSKISRRKTTK